MAINTDGQKRQGRFLKKNSKLLNAVSLVDFNFEQIATNPLVSFDNVDRTIIHAKFHDPSKLNTVVKKHGAMEQSVHDNSQPQLGIIFPADFTQDWHNERLNSKRRALGIEEDDDVDVLEEARFRSSNAQRATEPTHSEAKEPVFAHSANDSHGVQQFHAHTTSPEVIRAPEKDGMVRPLNEDDMASAIQKSFAGQKPAETPQNDEAQSFEPLPTDSADGPLSAEDRAIEAWKVKQSVAKQNEQLLDELRSEARSEGFQAGFREGEEKGLLSGQKQAAQVFSKVTEIMEEFSGLKQLVLENVQKNFYELSQAIGEALLAREFSIKPETYATMIQRVIKDTIAPNEFRIRLHPDTWQKVHDLNIADLDPFLVKDSAIPPGDFRVESALTVVDVNAKKLVTQLLEKADIDLFSDKKVS